MSSPTFFLNRNKLIFCLRNNVCTEKVCVGENFTLDGFFFVSNDFSGNRDSSKIKSRYRKNSKDRNIPVLHNASEDENERN